MESINFCIIDDDPCVPNIRINIDKTIPDDKPLKEREILSFTNKDNNEVFVKLIKRLHPIDLDEEDAIQVFIKDRHAFTIPKEDAIALSKSIIHLTERVSTDEKLSKKERWMGEDFKKFLEENRFRSL